MHPVILYLNLNIVKSLVLYCNNSLENTGFNMSSINQYLCEHWFILYF